MNNSLPDCENICSVLYGSGGASLSLEMIDDIIRHKHLAGNRCYATLLEVWDSTFCGA